MKNKESRSDFRPLFRQAPGEEALRQQVKSLNDKQALDEPLRPIDTKRLEANTAQLATYDRRRFLSKIGAAGVGLAAVGGIGGLAYMEVSKSAEESDERGRLIEYINELPETRIKSLLVDRILPRFESSDIQTVQRNGQTFEVGPGKVTERYGKAGEVFGQSIFDNTGDEDVVTPTEENKLQLPYVEGFIKPDELAKYPKGTQLAFDLHLSPKQPFNAVIRNEIIIERPNPKDVIASQQRVFDLSLRHVYLKEACSFLMFDLIAERMAEIMTAAGRPTAFEVLGKHGEKRMVDIVNNGLIGLESLKNRTLQVIDGGGFVLASQAQAHSDYLADLADSTQNPEFVYQTALLPIPEDNKDLLETALEFTLENAEILKEFGVQGDPTYYP